MLNIDAPCHPYCPAHPECEAITLRQAQDLTRRVIQKPNNPELDALRRAQDLTWPEHRRSLPSMASRHTVRPEHKKPQLVFS